MIQYIDKDTLVAEIENLENTYKKCPTRNSYEEGLKEGRLIGYKDALYKIDTLEVKEVDLEKELEVDLLQEFNDFLERENAYVDDDCAIFYYNGSTFNHTCDIYPIAKHFYELGLKAQKGE